MKQLLIISTWFQAVWFLAVVGQYQMQYLTLLLAAATVAVSILKANLNWARFALVVVLGVAVDYTNLVLGLLEFQNHQFPIWLLALWLIFAWYANFLYPILSRYPITIVSIVGGIGGTLSYLAGRALGAVAFGQPTQIMVAVLLVEWTLIIGIIIKVYGYESANNSSHLPHTNR